MPTALFPAPSSWRRGLQGIYSDSLFHYDERMLPIIQQGLELGRSFIQPAYWGKRGLDYLWMGIGAYIARYPQTRYLFGPVSISGTMPLAARDLLVAFYRLYFPTDLPLAKSRRPYPASLPEVLAQFTGDNYADDLRRLKHCWLISVPRFRRCTNSIRKCASRAACSLSISAAIRISITALMVWCWSICLA